MSENLKLKNIGVIGLGNMGRGIAQVIAQAGYIVKVTDQGQDLVDQGLEIIRGSLHRIVKKGSLEEKECNEILSRINGITELESFSDCDLIIEAIFEDLQVKTNLFKALDTNCRKDAIFASNTSSLSITQMAGVTSRKEKFIGMHFFQPAPTMPLVEVVKTISAAPEIVEIALDFVKSLGKVPVLAMDNSGFIVNLLLTPFMLDAMRAATSRVASIQDIDTGIKLGLGHPMGPLMLADFIGLDLIFNASNTMFEEYRESRYAPPPVLRKMVMLGYLGLKTKRGFYDWSDPKNPKPIDFNA